MLCLFRSRISNAGTLSSSVLRIHARQPINSNISVLRGYATRRPPSGPKRSPPPLQSSTPPSHRIPTAIPLASSGVNSRLKKIETAERLFKAGDKILYKSTRRTTLFRVHSWVLALVAGVGAFSFSSNGFLDVNTFYKSGHDYPYLIVVSYVTACVFLGAIIAFAVQRSRNHIHSINLVQQSGKVLLQVTSRSAIPFQKRSFTVQPYDFVVDSTFASVTNLPESLIPLAPSESSPSAFTAGVIRETFKSLSRSMYSTFDYFRAYFFRRGMFEVSVVQGEKGRKEYTMDAAGDYLLMKNKVVLWDVVEIKDPYDYL